MFGHVPDHLHIDRALGEVPAVLIAGEDTYGHFELLPPPEVDFGEDEKRRHADSVQRLFTVLKSD